VTGELRIVLVHPGGEELDLTSRLGEVGTLTESAEDDVLELTHGDLDFDVQDRDGEVSSFFDGAELGELYQVEVYRDPGRRRGMGLLWIGYVDPVETLSSNRKDGELSFEVYGLTKILEDTPADSLARTFSDIGTGSVTSGTRVVTLSDTTGILSGDTLRLADEDDDEEQLVETVVDGTTLRTTINWTNTFDEASAEIMTPFPRWQSPSALAALIVGASVFESGDLSISHRLVSRVPFVTPINVNGLPVANTILGSAVDTDDGELTISWVNGTTGTLGDYVGTPQDGFTGPTGPTTTTPGDWTPYMPVRPSNFPRAVLGDQGRNAWDHDGDLSYRMTTRATGTGPWTVFLDLHPSTGSDVNVDSFSTAVNPGSNPEILNYYLAKLDYDRTNGSVWVGYIRPAGATVAKSATARVPIGFPAADIPGLDGGHIRSIRQTPGSTRPTSMVWVSDDRQTVRFYDPVGLNLTRELTAAQMPPAGARLIPWSFRQFDAFNAACYVHLGRSRVLIWDQNWDIAADYDVGLARAFAAASNLTPDFDPQLYGYTDPVFGPCLIVYSGFQVYGILSRHYAGVIAYADLEDTSLSSALKDLAVMTLSFIRVDIERGVLDFVPRNFSAEPLYNLDDPAPLEEEEMRLSSVYRSSVQVSGETPEGDSFEVVMGSSLARRAEVESKFVQSESVALALASALSAQLGTFRREMNHTRIEDVERVRALSVVERLGSRWLVFSSELNLENREQTIRLVEIA